MLACSRREMKSSVSASMEFLDSVQVKSRGVSDMVSDFGKELRKIRIDNGEVLKDMADKLKVTSSYLSAIENGKRAVPANFVGEIISLYELSEKRQEVLRLSYDNSLKTVSLDLDGKKFAKRELALKFARSFEDMSDEKAKKLLSFIDRE